MSTRHMVVSFHAKYGQPIGAKPRCPPDARVRFRWALMLEEMREAFEATYDFRYGVVGQPGQVDYRTMQMAWGLLERMAQNQGIMLDIIGFSDGLIDTKYVVEGTLVEFGVDGEPLMREVQRANMAKLPNPGGKPIKPEDWTPPNIRQCLLDQGWEPQEGYFEIPPDIMPWPCDPNPAFGRMQCQECSGKFQDVPCSRCKGVGWVDL